jgi:phosphoribosylanthranilate isomerase
MPRVRVKICGLTTPADAERVAAGGADLVGLNFYPRSPRCISETAARAILDVLPAHVEAVGLFVNESAEQIRAVVQRLALRTVQWHGDAGPAVPTDDYRLIPAFPVRDADSLAAIRAYLARCEKAGRWPAALLVDAHVPGAYGGTGRTAPWRLLGDFRPGVPLILAGGLTPDNVADAVRIVRPDAVDVASGVESAPGVKDPDKVRRFIDAVRAVE